MRAYGHTRAAPLGDEDAIVGIDAPEPEAGPRDLLVRVRAVSVNPVDTKVRGAMAPEGAYRILGWDAAGEVVAVGDAVEGFAPGDEVYYAGALDRPGSDAELQAVDHRIAAKKPRSLDFTDAAALPLTAITAWEMLFDRFRVPSDGSGSLLIVGAGGGVGSIAIQLARALTGLEVIATASRPDTADWVRELGAHHVVDHHGDLAGQVREVAPDGVRYAFGINATGEHFPAIVEAMAPQGHIGLIDDPDTLDVQLLKTKALTLTWEFMFTRSLFETPDMGEQGRLLGEVARLVDEGRIRTTAARRLGTLGVDTLREAHELLESGRSRGKIVLEVA